jgi:hypothetical protein
LASASCWTSPKNDLSSKDGTIVIRHGNGDKRRIIGLGAWGLA